MVDVDSNKGMVVKGSGEDLAGRTGAPDQAEYCRGTFEQVTSFLGKPTHRMKRVISPCGFTNVYLVSQAEIIMLHLNERVIVSKTYKINKHVK